VSKLYSGKDSMGISSDALVASAGMSMVDNLASPNLHHF